MRRLLLVLITLGLLLGGCGTVPTDEPAAPSPSLESPAPVEPAPSPDDTGGTTDDEQSELTETVRQQLAAALGQAAGDLTLEDMQAVEWNDGALGCPEPGMMYIQAIEPGYRLTFSDGTQTYEVHTSARSGTMIWCDNGQPKPLTQS